MAHGLRDTTGLKSCDNCLYHGWEQPKDQATIQQCARCKVTTYCSKQCQQEHWHNVHKQHCKYLSGQRVLAKSWHEEASCLVCRVVASTGVVEMAKPGNPVMPCPLMLETKLSTPLPFALAEMTGNFLNKEEATVTFMMQILLKMKLNKHPVWVINSKLAVELYNVLEDTRKKCFAGYLIANPGARLDEVAIMTHRNVTKITLLIVEIDKLLSAVNSKPKKQEEFRPYDTLKILASFLFMLKTSDRSTAECVGLPDLSEDLERSRVSSALFNKVCQKVLDMMRGGLVPYLTLVEVLCGGELRQTCYGCSKEVTVLEVIHDFLCWKCVPVRGPVLLFGNISIILCGKFTCAQSGVKLIEESMDLVFLVYRRLAAEFGSDRCDYCALFYRGVRGHRCSRCLTKVYCGEQCRDLDWGVHKLVCREGEEERKKKVGKQMRKQKGGEFHDTLIESMERQERENRGNNNQDCKCVHASQPAPAVASPFPYDFGETNTAKSALAAASPFQFGAPSSTSAQTSISFGGSWMSGAGPTFDYTKSTAPAPSQPPGAISFISTSTSASTAPPVSTGTGFNFLTAPQNTAGGFSFRGAALEAASQPNPLGGQANPAPGLEAPNTNFGAPVPALSAEAGNSKFRGEAVCQQSRTCSTQRRIATARRRSKQ